MLLKDDKNYSAGVTLLIECRLSYVFNSFSLPSITFYHPQRKSWEGMFSQLSVCLPTDRGGYLWSHVLSLGRWGSLVPGLFWGGYVGGYVFQEGGYPPPQPWDQPPSWSWDTMAWDTVGKRAVCILLECFLITR